jgi:hypothetical protein
MYTKYIAEMLKILILGLYLKGLLFIYLYIYIFGGGGGGGRVGGLVVNKTTPSYHLTG